MKKILIGGAVVLALGALGAAVAVLANDDDSRRAGAFTIANPTPIPTLTTTQPPPPPSPPSLTSPNGDFTLEVTDTGIRLTGPAATVRLTADGVVVEADKDVNVTAGLGFAVAAGSHVAVDAGATFSAQASGAANVQGSTLRLNCSSGGQRVGRLADPVAVNEKAGTAAISGGSTTVYAC
jgi:hypothetical protein